MTDEEFEKFELCCESFRDHCGEFARAYVASVLMTLKFFKNLSDDDAVILIRRAHLYEAVRDYPPDFYDRSPQEICDDLMGNFA